MSTGISQCLSLAPPPPSPFLLLPSVVLRCCLGKRRRWREERGGRRGRRESRDVSNSGQGCQRTCDSFLTFFTFLKAFSNMVGKIRKLMIQQCKTRRGKGQNSKSLFFLRYLCSFPFPPVHIPPHHHSFSLSLSKSLFSFLLLHLNP